MTRPDPEPPDALAATNPAPAAPVDPAASALTIASQDTMPAAAESRPRLREGTRLDRYLIRDILGIGGMGIVYGARDPKLDRDVAIKVLRPELASSDPAAARRIVHEARVMAKISHPNVLGVFDVGTVDDQVFIVMELVAGTNLREWLGRGKHSVADILEAFVAAGRGLIAAHDAGVVHRDFKPDNVLIGGDGRVRVTDFGLAVQYRQPDDHAIDGGTPAYMAPEQFEGGSIDARSDQFSFCVALYEALYGTRPFAGKTVPALAEAITQGKLLAAPADSRVPASLRALLVRGLAVTPGDRFPTLGELLRTLGRDRGRRPRLLAIVATVALVVVGTGFVADWVVRDRERVVTKLLFRNIHTLLDKAIEIETRTFSSETESLYRTKALEEMIGTQDNSEFGLDDAAAYRAIEEQKHTELTSASWVGLTRTHPGDEIAIADRRGRLLYNSVSPQLWGRLITRIPAVERAYTTSAEASLAVLDARDPVVVESGVLGASGAGLYVMFARVRIEHEVVQAGFVRLVPTRNLIDSVTLATSDDDPTYMSIMLPDGKIEGSVPPDLAVRASNTVEEVTADGDGWLVQRSPLPGDELDGAQIILARRADVGLAGLFPHARVVLAMLAAALAGLAIGGALLARRLDLTRR